MAKADIWMPLYIGDYLADTMDLNTEQHGAYILLLMAYWKNGGALLNDDLKLATITRLSADAWSMHKHTLASFFDLESDPALWIHVRAEKEMDKAGNNQEKRTLRAQAAAAARWNKNAPSNAQAMLETCPSPSPSPSPLKEKQDQKTCSTPSVERVDFEKFWSIYPKKVGKAKAIKSWEKLNPDMILFASIEESLQRAKRSPDWIKGAGQFIPHPSVWLNGRRWEDEPDSLGDLPYEAISVIYNEECGHVFRKCEAMGADRMILIRDLVSQEIGGKQRFMDGGLDYWRRFFAVAAKSKAWAGENRTGFVADFDHVIRNATAVFEASK